MRVRLLRRGVLEGEKPRRVAMALSAAPIINSLSEGRPAAMSEPLVESVEALYAEHYDTLYRYLLRLGCSETQADDMLQEAFLRLFVTLKQGVRIEKPKYWLLRVVRNIRIDEGREHWRETHLDEGELEAEAVVALGHSPDAESEFIGREWIDAVNLAVRGLPPRQYDYLLLRAEGLTLKEIAEMKGVSIQTVSEALARAIDRIWRVTHE